MAVQLIHVQQRSHVNNLIYHMSKNTLLKGAFIALIAFLISAPAFSQNYTAAETKSIEKSKTLYNKGKYDKAVSTITKVQMGHIDDEELWNLRVIYENTRYRVQLSSDIAAIIKKAGKGGNVNVDFDKLKSTTYRGELIFACYMATLHADHQDLASMIMHNMIVKPSVDTSISDEAKEYREKGDVEYAEKSYSAAIRQYEKALGEDANYYGATFDIGFCYYKDEKYEKAATWFRKAIALQPEMLDPRYYLIECLKNDKKWDEMYTECIEGIIQYPYVGYFTWLEEACEKKDKTLKRHWMSRDYLPNMIGVTSQSTPDKDPWTFYRNAKDKMYDYCDDDGVITKSQTLTESKYLEVYSWEYMMKKDDSDEKEIAFARKMQDAGYLDCFSMVSMFHIAFWDQYKAFRDADGNRARIKSYIETQLIK